MIDDLQAKLVVANLEKHNFECVNLYTNKRN